MVCQQRARRSPAPRLSGRTITVISSWTHFPHVKGKALWCIGYRGDPPAMIVWARVLGGLACVREAVQCYFGRHSSSKKLHEQFRTSK